MDVLLAHGYFLSADREEQRIMRPHPPLGLLYLSSHLKAKGFDVGVFDGTFRRLEDFADCLKRLRPPVVGLAVNMMTKRNALRMIAMAREAGARVVVGGPDPPHYAEEYLRAGADVVVIGEGEQTLEELLPILQSGALEQLAGISGIAFLNGRPEGQPRLWGPASAGPVVSRTPARPLLPDLDRQPFPDRQALDIDAYMQAWRGRHGFAPVSLITARGCPYTCAWCSRSVFGTTHRRRSPENVADEVEDIVARYHPDRLWYADDVFAIHRGWTLAYATVLEKRRLRLPFECISRAERIDEDVADALVSLGCWRVWIGAESGSQRILDAMQRRVTLDRVVRASALLRRRGIQVGMFIMLGYEGERDQDLRDTVQHLKRAMPDIYLTTVCVSDQGHAVLRRGGRSADVHPARGPSERIATWSSPAGRARRYYDFARRWMVGEVARAAHWEQRPLRAGGARGSRPRSSDGSACRSRQEAS